MASGVLTNLDLMNFLTSSWPFSGRYLAGDAEPTNGGHDGVVTTEDGGLVETSLSPN